MKEDPTVAARLSVENLLVRSALAENALAESALAENVLAENGPVDSLAAIPAVEVVHSPTAEPVVAAAFVVAASGHQIPRLQNR